MAEELIDICDDNMRPIGTETRTEAHRSGLWHVAVHCWIVRPEPPGHVLFSRRAVGTATRGGLLDVTALGHPESGESIDERLTELVKGLGIGNGESPAVPLGVKIDVNRLGNDVVIREFCPTYFATSHRPAHEYSLDHEVQTAMVEVAVPDGLDLFSSRAPRVGARGMEYDIDSATWRRVGSEVERSQFLPRVDPYYYKVFIMAERLLQGARDLAV